QSEDGSTRPQSRGGKGRHDIKTTERNGNVVAVRGVKEGDSLMFISQGGMLVRVAAKTISRIGRNTQGVRLVNLKEGDKLIAAARVADSDMSGEKEPDALPPAPSLPPTPN
ncbi:MAG: hypothetical protein L0219_03350, partial [Phycisphaerales bacterium]|nr:hypothetical protein [Phycisphaerales bacterium]